METWYDGVDADCDDTDALVNPDTAEVWYDDVDQDCDGNDNDVSGEDDGIIVEGGCDCDSSGAGAGGLAALLAGAALVARRRRAPVG